MKVISTLEIVDVQTGERTALRSYDYLIEAPNWTSDGKRLIYNSRGCLYSFDIATCEIVQIDSGLQRNVITIMFYLLTTLRSQLVIIQKKMVNLVYILFRWRVANRL